jgi:hypothetical protein
MRDRTRFVGIAFVATLALSSSPAFSQAQPQSRIPQQIVINGQMASGAYVTAAGGQMQSFTCPSPQQYATADGSSHGWACYEQTTGVWLLNAVPPQAQTAPVPTPVPSPAPTPPPQVVVPEPPPVWYPRMPPAVVYQPPTTVVYQQPAVIYQQPTTVVVQQPAPATVVYAPPPPPVVVAPTYPSSVVIGKAAIEAAGRIASAVILNSHHPQEYYYYDYGPFPGRGRGRR